MTAVGQQRAIEGKQTGLSNKPHVWNHVNHVWLYHVQHTFTSPLGPNEVPVIVCCSSRSLSCLVLLSTSFRVDSRFDTFSAFSCSWNTKTHTHKWKPNLPNGSNVKMTSTALLTSLIVLLISLFAVSRSSGRALFNNLANSWWHRDTF